MQYLSVANFVVAELKLLRSVFKLQQVVQHLLLLVIAQTHQVHLLQPSVQIQLPAATLQALLVKVLWHQVKVRLQVQKMQTLKVLIP